MPYYVEGYGNTIEVGNTVNLGGLNQPSLDTGNGTTHGSNAVANGGPGTDYQPCLPMKTEMGLKAMGTSRISPKSIEEFTNIIEKIADVRAENSAEQQQVNQSLGLHQNNLVNLEAAHGRIMDVDVALESTRLARTA